MTEQTEVEEYFNSPFHPYNVLLTLVLGGITALFLAFSAAYIYTRVQSGVPPLKLHPIFAINTVMLLLSSYTMHLANKAYLADKTSMYKTAIGITILLSIAFMASQYFGWKLMIADEIFVYSDNSASYLYLISGLHFLHVVAGLPFLILFFIVAIRKMKEPHTVLIYFTNPEKRLKLKLLTRYWHYLDALWIYLVLFFVINYCIQ